MERLTLVPRSVPGSTAAARRWLVPYLVVLLAWMAWRAAELALTCDEATTLRWHVPATWGRIFAFKRPIGSNNHLLNTLLIKLLLGFLPAKELVVRLPALLGFALYCAAARRWSLGWTSGARVLLGLILLTANPFVLDMGVLARGYGLALGLWAWAAVLLLEWGREPRPSWRLPAAAACAALALCANLSLVFPVAALGGLSLPCAVRGARRAGGPRWGTLGLASASWALAAGALACLYRPEVVERIQHSLEGWGGWRGVWVDSVASLVSASLPRTADPRWSEAGALALLVLLVLGSVQALLVWRRTGALGPLFLASAFTWLVLAMLCAHHWIAGARFPLDRGVLVLIPAFTVVFMLLWEHARAVPWRAERLAPWLACVLLGLDLLACRFRTTHVWWFDASAREAMQAIALETRGRPPGSVRLAVWRPVWSAIEHYRTTLGVAALAPTLPEPPAPGADLYYYRAADAAQVSAFGLETVARFPLGDTLLARPASQAEVPR